MTPICLVLIMYMLIILINLKEINKRSSNSPFECGFDSKSYTRLPFSFRFFNLTLIFIIFDMEMIFLFSLIKINNFYMPKIYMIILFLFFFTLIISLMLEWMINMLDWV
uniref:NADH-ubiquinone oxidoreductase chain 3 n=1 Tax=Arisubathynella cheongmiensis TaxID=2025387 RepID=A0A7R6D7H1_9CRUS|nr:NADH dehydrogenase subunit 3 [Arisubathynella cheongmiensis]